MMKIFACCAIFCGCSVDGAFNTPQGTVIWGVAFVTAILCAMAMGVKSK